MNCSIEGCDRRRYARGVCSMHYLRLRRRGSAGSAASEKGTYGNGSVNAQGYRTIHAAGHPLVTSQGKALEHRVVLFDSIGDGPHPCHWCGTSLPWRGRPAARICVDHLDDNRTNNAPANLVPSCLDCNTKRAA